MLNFGTMKALKTIFVWILLFALPLQGFAAAPMSLCATGEAVLEMASGAQHAAAPSARSGDCGHHQATPPEASFEDCDSPSDTATCSACAACSVGASISAAFATLPAFNAHGAESIPYVAAHDTACIYGALERPPHTLA